MNRWKKVAEALIRLAEDQRGKPEGDLAREKLALILNRHPEARQYQPIQRLMASDVAYMRRQGISTDGSWTGRNLGEALLLMEAEYRQRIDAHRARRRLEVLAHPRLYLPGRGLP